MMDAETAADLAAAGAGGLLTKVKLWAAIGGILAAVTTGGVSLVTWYAGKIEHSVLIETRIHALEGSVEGLRDDVRDLDHQLEQDQVQHARTEEMLEALMRAQGMIPPPRVPAEP